MVRVSREAFLSCYRAVMHSPEQKCPHAHEKAQVRDGSDAYADAWEGSLESNTKLHRTMKNRHVAMIRSVDRPESRRVINHRC